MVPLVLATAVVLGGCVSDEQEQELGDLMAAEMNVRLSLLADPSLRGYIEGMGDEIAEVSDRPGIDYNFYIINSEMVNAFALPGGHVYITRGLIERTRSGPELAGVIAHEIGHVAARHGVRKLERNLRTGSLMSLLYQLLLGGQPELLRRNSVELAGMLWNAQHSRADERKADRLAVRYVIRAGIDPHGVVSLLETLVTEEAHDSGRVAGWFSTHPMTRSRIRFTRREIDQALEGRSPELDRRMSSYPEFRERIAALPPAPDAAEPGF